METSKIQLVKQLNKQARIVRSYLATYEKCRDGEGDKTHLLNKADDLLGVLREFCELMFKFGESVNSKEICGLHFRWQSVEIVYSLYQLAARYDLPNKRAQLYRLADDVVKQYSDLVVDLVRAFGKCIGSEA